MDDSGHATCRDLYEFYLDFQYPVTGVPILETMRRSTWKKGFKILAKKWFLNIGKLNASFFWRFNCRITRILCDKAVNWSVNLNFTLEESFVISCEHRKSVVELKRNNAPSKLKKIVTSNVKNLTIVVIFAYNRPSTLKLLLSSLEKSTNLNRFHFLFFIDGPKNPSDIPLISESKEIIEEFDVASKDIITQDINLGLHNSVISGLNSVFCSHDFAVILEDDLECQPQLLAWFSEESRLINETSDLAALCAYFPLVFETPPVGNFTNRRFHSWGWATRKENWGEVNFSQNNLLELALDRHFRKKLFQVSSDLLPMAVAQLNGSISSWAIKFIFSGVNLNKQYCFPPIRLIENNGFDSMATHTQRKPGTQRKKITVYKKFQDVSRSVRAYYA